MIHGTCLFVLTQTDELCWPAPLLDGGRPDGPGVDLGQCADLLGDFDALLNCLQARDDLRLHRAVLPRHHLARLLWHLLHHSLHFVPKGAVVGLEMITP